MKAHLSKLSIKGFKSIQSLESFSPQALNVFIGPNGAGKSNFISFFTFLNWMLHEQMQEHIARLGGANAILHDGAEITRELEAQLSIKTESGWNDYAFRLFFAGGDRLVFAEEKYRYSAKGRGTVAGWLPLDVGQQESQILSPITRKNSKSAKVIFEFLHQINVFQFHNTSFASRMRTRGDLNEFGKLKKDARNIAPFLYWIRERHPIEYKKIVNLLRLILPFFHDFILYPMGDHILLQWREKGSDCVFNASQASDGMLRTIALIALLCQPINQLPNVIVLDEPELGLHPYAITTIAGLIKTASRHVQIFVATQSPTLIDHFEPKDIVVVERKERSTTFNRLDSKSLSNWLKEYSLSELWGKNVLGGKP